MVFVAAPVHAAGIVPTASTPVTLSYSGTFDLANAIIPQATQHSYVYHVQWAYSWSGTWGELFAQGSPISTETSFDLSKITGSMHAVWRDVSGGPLIGCTLRIVPDIGDYPVFGGAIYAAEGGASASGARIADAPLRAVQPQRQLEPPSMCGVAAPRSTSSARRRHGARSGRGRSRSGSGPGRITMTRNWAWTVRFASGFRRVYTSAIHTSLVLGFPSG